MARTVKPTFKQWIPGSGRTAGGVPVQGKTRTVGRITLSVGAGGSPGEGERLTPADVGLSTIDFIALKVVEEMGNTVTRQAVYSASAQQFYVFEVLTSTGTYQDASSTSEVSFIAEGDSVMDVELL